jgi:hypothetical protein
MRGLLHPGFVGALVSGIVFNIVLMVLGELGFSFWEALYLAAASFIVSCFLGVRWLIRRAGKKVG